MIVHDRQIQNDFPSLTKRRTKTKTTLSFSKMIIFKNDNFFAFSSSFQNETIVFKKNENDSFLGLRHCVARDWKSIPFKLQIPPPCMGPWGDLKNYSRRIYIFWIHKRWSNMFIEKVNNVLALVTIFFNEEKQFSNYLRANSTWLVT